MREIKKMGLIREPKNVDFTVLDKPWTAEEKKGFSAFIKKLKSQNEKKNFLKHKSNTKITD